MFAYCLNNPVMNHDPSGTSWSSFWNSVGNWFKSNWQKVIMITASVVEVIAGVAIVIFLPVKSVGFMLVVTGVGSVIDGFLTESTGGSFTAGWHGGQLGGLLSAIPAIGPALGAFAGSVVSDMFDKGVKNIDWGKAGWSAALGFALGAPYGIDSPKISKTLYDLLVAKNGILTGLIGSIIGAFR